jgi:hypothetical protein
MDGEMRPGETYQVYKRHRRGERLIVVAAVFLFGLVWGYMIVPSIAAGCRAERHVEAHGAPRP